MTAYDLLEAAMEQFISYVVPGVLVEAPFLVWLLISGKVDDGILTPVAGVMVAATPVVGFAVHQLARLLFEGWERTTSAIVEPLCHLLGLDRNSAHDREEAFRFWEIAGGHRRIPSHWRDYNTNAFRFLHALQSAIAGAGVGSVLGSALLFVWCRSCPSLAIALLVTVGGELLLVCLFGIRMGQTRERLEGKASQILRLYKKDVFEPLAKKYRNAAPDHN